MVGGGSNSEKMAEVGWWGWEGANKASFITQPGRGDERSTSCLYGGGDL